MLQLELHLVRTSLQRQWKCCQVGIHDDQLTISKLAGIGVQFSGLNAIQGQSPNDDLIE